MTELTDYKMCSLAPTLDAVMTFRTEMLRNYHLILKSAFQNSQSEERLKQCQHSSILSPRFSLTDSQLIEEQTPDSDDHPIVEKRKSTIPSYESTKEGARQSTVSVSEEVKSDDLLSTFEVEPTHSFYKSKSESGHDMVNASFLLIRFNQHNPFKSMFRHQCCPQIYPMMFLEIIQKQYYWSGWFSNRCYTLTPW